ncbi:MAG: hypothetical protein N4A74_12345 [Carboxylicivirga sp.]|jgi:hypothetical protein|nr:hypothetical protein [Carboxylicivirga sp.]
MVDFVKLLIVGLDIKALMSNKLLDFKVPHNTKNQIASWNDKDNNPAIYYKAVYRSLEFRIYPETGILIVMGSLHRYWNNGQHNHNNFSHDDLISVLNDLYQKFGFEPQNMKLQQMEFGINIIPDFPVDKLISHCLFHRKKRFLDKLVKDGKSRCVQHSNRYTLKVYNKSTQQRLRNITAPQNLFRIEINYRAKLKSMGIRTVADYLDADRNIFLTDLLKAWSEILFFDWTVKNDEVDNQLYLRDYRSELFWEELIKHGTNGKYKWHLKKLQKYIINHSLNIKETVAKQIEILGMELLRTTNPNASNKGCIRVACNKVVKKKTIKKCLVTGIDITHQRRDSRFLSVTGLKKLYKENYTLFDQLAKEYLSNYNYFFITDIEQRIKLLAIAIKSRYFNNKKLIDKGIPLRRVCKRKKTSKEITLKIPFVFDY